MKLSVCVDALFGSDTLNGIKTVKDCGINTFEFWCWWDKDIDALIKTKTESGMDIAAFCTKFISLVDASRREEYLAGLAETISVAQKLNCKTLITQVGDFLPDVPAEEQHKNLVDGLKACVPLLEKSGITLVFEPLNTTVDHKGYYLWSSDESFAICDEVGSPYVKVLYDIYHQQIMEGNLISRITANIDKIGHFHAAGNPGRNELSRGEINYPEIFKAIEDTNYTGYMGLEYIPLEDPAKGLKELMK